MTVEDSLSMVRQTDQTVATTKAIMYVVLGVALYFVPSIIAQLRRHAQLGAIVLVNVLLGWTCIGWIVALVWAFINPAQPVTVNVERVASSGRSCLRCGTINSTDASFCSKCGGPFGQIGPTS